MSNAAAPAFPPQYLGKVAQLPSTTGVTWQGTATGSAAPLAPAWAPTTGVTAAVSVVTNGGNLYVCKTPGTTAGSGGPTGTGADITDGTAHWTYVTDTFPANGVTITNADPAAALYWGLRADMTAASGDLIPAGSWKSLPLNVSPSAIFVVGGGVYTVAGLV